MTEKNTDSGNAKKQRFFRGKTKERSAVMPMMVGNNSTKDSKAEKAKDKSKNKKKQDNNVVNGAAVKKQDKSVVLDNKHVKLQTSAHENGANAGGQKKSKGPKLKVMFLGGVGEIGKNMTAIEYGDDIIIVDAGVSFPNEDMPGIDLVIPDISYLTAHSGKIRGVVLTHGHEDHIGGLPYLLKEIKIPVYGTKLTLALSDNKLREHKINDAEMHVIKPGSIIKLGCFSVEFVNVTHSIAGAVALAIGTPYGTIFHTGDYKMDLAPVSGLPMDLTRISEIGKKGVLLLMADSTNVERPGYTMGEAVVGETLDGLFSEYVDKRLIIATFASNVHRIQQIMELAAKFKRKVVLSGRSMINVVEAAGRIGEINYPKDIIIDIDKIKNMHDRELVIISTGSQGEPMSALTRMASGEFNKVKIGENDAIIISASPIPGNEKMIYRVINNLYRKGADVIYEALENVHVSGHACQEELKLLHSLVKPKFFIPVHGEYRHLKRHAQLAQQMGMRKDNILIAEIGNSVNFTDKTMIFGDNFTAGARLVDGLETFDGDESIILRDRRHLAEDGLFAVVVGISSESGLITSGPDIVNKGFVGAGESEMVNDIKSVVINTLSQMDLKGDGDKSEAQSAIKRAIRNYIYKKTKKNPMILPIIMLT